MAAHPLRRLLGVALALGLAYGAQALFEHNRAVLDGPARVSILATPVYALAVVLLLLGAILFALMAPKDRYPDLTSGPPDAIPSSSSRLILAVALFAYGLAVTLYLGNGETALVRGFWVASVLLLILAQVAPEDLSRLVTYARNHWQMLAGSALLLTLAGFLRLYRLTTLPQDLHGDMASHGMQAWALLDGRVTGIVGTGWANIPLPGFLPTVVTMALSGDRGLLGLNLASAIGGLASIAGLMALLAQLASRRVALLAGFLLSVSYAHIHFSRIAEYMDPLPFAVWALAFLVWGLRSRRMLAFTLSGCLLAGASLMYYAGRAALVVVALFLLYQLIVDSRVVRANGRGLLALAGAFLVTLGPLLFYLIGHSDAFLSRSQEVFLFNPAVLTHLAGKYGVESPAVILLEQARRSLLAFNLTGDTSTQFGLVRPLVDPLTGPLVVLGLVYALAHWRRPIAGLLGIWLVVLLVLGGMLTNNAPFWPRLVMGLLPAAALAAVALDRSWTAVVDATGSRGGHIAAVIMAALLVYLAIGNWLLYWAFATNNGRPRALVGRLVASLPPDATVCLVSEDREDPDAWIHSVAEREIAFFLPPRQGVDISGDLSFVLSGDGGPCTQPGAVWIVPSTKAAVLAQLGERYPGGVIELQGSWQGDTSFFSFRIP
jgi:hypothetical protein